MSQIKQLLKLHKLEKGEREIACILGISKNTLKAYLEKLSLTKLGIEYILLLDDHVLVAKFHPGNPAYNDERFEGLKLHMDYFKKELKRNVVPRKLLWEEYRKDFPEGFGLTQFYYHLSQYSSASNPSMVL